MKYCIVGYSGHAFVVIESASDAGWKAEGYFEVAEKALNPYQLKYLGVDSPGSIARTNLPCFVAIGSNDIRQRIFRELEGKARIMNVLDPSAIVSQSCVLASGVYVGRGAKINALSRIGNAVIVNTGAIVEHECVVGDFAHIAPGAVLCGDVRIGAGSFVGANSVVKQGVRIGNNVTIGAGSVVLSDVPDNVTAYGNPIKR